MSRICNRLVWIRKLRTNFNRNYCTQNLKSIGTPETQSANGKSDTSSSSSSNNNNKGPSISVTFVLKNGERRQIDGHIGENLLSLAHRHAIEMEGACEASLACTTCHVYVDHRSFAKLPESSEREDDLLDSAPVLKENSRLGCQVILTAELNGAEFTLPRITKNFYVDGHVPKPH